jgi:histidine triad (HIT) family protein
MATIFSKIIAGEIPSYKIAEDEFFYAFLDIFPIAKGHVLIVPKIEIDKVFDVPDEYLTRWMTFAKPIAKAIEASFKCNRCAIAFVGLEVPHAHMHLYPITHILDADITGEKLKLAPEELLAIQETIVNKL